MRMVVDSNYLQHDNLRTFLRQSTYNSVVLTDYAWMEAYKGDTLVSICKSMQILCDYPSQVVLLKGTSEVSRLSGRPAGLTRRMTDLRGPHDFGIFCKQLRAYIAGDRSFERQILQRGKWATDHLANVRQDASTIEDSFDEVMREFYTDEEVRTIRARKPLGGAIVAKMMDFALELTMTMRARHPGGAPRVDRGELHNAFLFRHSVCLQVLHWIWMESGGKKNLRPEKVANDLVDLNFATYATYFDGILTNDRKLTDVYTTARWMIGEMEQVASEVRRSS